MTMGVVLGTVAVALVITLRIGSSSWRRMVERVLAAMRVEAHTWPSMATRYVTESVAHLPSPVQRYFAFALSQGQPLIVAARADSQGAFRMQLDGSWHAFTALQQFNAAAPAFIWDASIQIAPLVKVNVADRYLDGVGSIDARAFSVIPVVSEHGTPELAAGELLRYLAELAMIPTALLPRSGVTWSPVDDDKALVTLADRGTTVSVTVHFGARGQIARVSADRHRDIGGTPVLTPWIGYFRNYVSVQGMMVPMYAQAAWVVDGVVKPYFRGRITGIAFEFAR